MEKEYNYREVNYVVCMDTLGQDRTLTEQDRRDLNSLVQFYSEQWTSTESHLLQDNIEKHVEYRKSIPIEFPEKEFDQVGLANILADLEERE